MVSVGGELILGEIICPTCDLFVIGWRLLAEVVGLM